MSKDLDTSFRSTATLTEAETLRDLLHEKGISSRITKDEGDLDYVFQGETPTYKFEILLNEHDFPLAQKILSDIATEQLSEVASDYYLFSFSDDELLDVLIEKDEWNELDVQLSEKILADRGVLVDLDIIKKQRELRNAEISKPKGGQMGWIIVGYFSAVLGGFLGLVIGYFIWKAKNKLPNGKKVPAYTENSRKHGLTIFLISLVVFPTMLILRLAFDII